MQNVKSSPMPEVFVPFITPFKGWEFKEQNYYPEELVPTANGQTFKWPARIELVLPSEVLLLIIGSNGKLVSKELTDDPEGYLIKGINILNKMLSIRKEFVTACAEKMDQFSLSHMNMRSEDFFMESFRYKSRKTGKEAISSYTGSTGWFIHHSQLSSVPKPLQLFQRGQLTERPYLSNSLIPNTSSMKVEPFDHSPLLITPKKRKATLNKGTIYPEMDYCIGEYFDVVLKDIILSHDMKISEYRDIVRQFCRYETWLTAYGSELAFHTELPISIITKTEENYFRNVYVKPCFSPNGKNNMELEHFLHSIKKTSHTIQTNWHWHVRDGVYVNKEGENDVTLNK